MFMQLELDQARLSNIGSMRCMVKKIATRRYKAARVTSARRREAGLTLVEVVVVVGLIGLLAAIAVPNFLRSRVIAQKDACISNLREIDNAIQVWALEKKVALSGAVTETDILPYLHGTTVCPAGGKTFADSYAISIVAAQPICLISPATHALPVASTDVTITSSGSSGKGGGGSGTGNGNGGGNGQGNNGNGNGNGGSNGGKDKP